MSLFAGITIKAKPEATSTASTMGNASSLYNTSHLQRVEASAGSHSSYTDPTNHRGNVFQESSFPIIPNTQFGSPVLHSAHATHPSVSNTPLSSIHVAPRNSFTLASTETHNGRKWSEEQYGLLQETQQSLSGQERTASTSSAFPFVNAEDRPIKEKPVHISSLSKALPERVHEKPFIPLLQCSLSDTSSAYNASIRDRRDELYPTAALTTQVLSTLLNSTPSVKRGSMEAKFPSMANAAHVANASEESYISLRPSTYSLNEEIAAVDRTRTPTLHDDSSTIGRISSDRNRIGDTWDTADAASTFSVLYNGEETLEFPSMEVSDFGSRNYIESVAPEPLVRNGTTANEAALDSLSRSPFPLERKRIKSNRKIQPPGYANHIASTAAVDRSYPLIATEGQGVFEGSANRDSPSIKQSDATRRLLSPKHLSPNTEPFGESHVETVDTAPGDGVFKRIPAVRYVPLNSPMGLDEAHPQSFLTGEGCGSLQDEKGMMDEKSRSDSTMHAALVPSEKVDPSSLESASTLALRFDPPQLSDINSLETCYYELLGEAHKSFQALLDSDSASLDRLDTYFKNEEILRGDMELKEAQQSKFAELERFDEAAQLDGIIKDLKKKKLFISENRIQALTITQKEMAVAICELTGKCHKGCERIVERLKYLKNENCESAMRAVDEHNQELLCETTKLEEEKEGNTMNMQRLVEEEIRLKEETRKISDLIEMQTKSLVDEIEVSKEKESLVRKRIEELENQLKDQRALQCALLNKIGANEFKISAVRSKFDKQLQWIERAETNLQENRQELYVDRERVEQSLATVTAKKAHIDTIRQNNVKLLEDYDKSIVLSTNRCEVLRKLVAFRHKWSEVISKQVAHLSSFCTRLAEGRSKVDIFSGEVEQLETKVENLQTSTNAIQSRLSEAIMEKKSAISNRAFKEAGKLTVEIKELEQNKAKVAGELSIAKSELEEMREQLRVLEELAIPLGAEYDAELRESNLKRIHDISIEICELNELKAEASHVCTYLSDIIDQQIFHLKSVRYKLCKLYRIPIPFENSIKQDERADSNSTYDCTDTNKTANLDQSEEAVLFGDLLQNEKISVSALQRTPNTQGTEGHTEMTPASLNMLLANLRLECENAIEAENFYKAAALDDEIKLLEEEMATTQAGSSTDMLLDIAQSKISAVNGFTKNDSVTQNPIAIVSDLADEQQSILDELSLSEQNVTTLPYPPKSFE